MAQGLRARGAGGSWCEAVLRDYVGGSGVGVGVLVGLVHGEAGAPDVLESRALGKKRSLCEGLT